MPHKKIAIIEQRAKYTRKQILFVNHNSLNNILDEIYEYKQLVNEMVDKDFETQKKLI